MKEAEIQHIVGIFQGLIFAYIIYCIDYHAARIYNLWKKNIKNKEIKK